MDHNSTPTNTSVAFDSQAELLRDISRYLWVVLAPVLLLVGTVGNILSLVTLHIKPFRGTGTSFVLCALAFVDTGTLYSGLLVDFINYASNRTLHIRMFGQASCKILVFLALCLSIISSWTIVEVTIGRAIMVCYPHKAKRLCSRRNMAWAWTILATTAILLQAHSFWTVNLTPKTIRTPNGTVETNPDILFCEESSVDPLRAVLVSKDFLLISVLPALIIIVTNAVIIYRLTVKPLKKQQASLPIRSGKAKHRGNSVSKMLVTVSVVFLVTTLPAALFFSVKSQWYLSKPSTLFRDAEYELAYTCTLLLHYINSAINIFLYVLSGRSFRKALMDLLTRRFCNSPQPSDQMNLQEGKTAGTCKDQQMTRMFRREEVTGNDDDTRVKLNDASQNAGTSTAEKYLEE